jgi:small subunit ribosomal protein S8
MDPIANMLIMLKNASLVNKASVTVPHSKMKEAVLNLLKEEGYVKAVSVEGDTKKTLEVALMYKGTAPRIKGVTRVSKSSKRVYTGVKSIAPVRYGHGLLVLSTPKGIMTDKMARKEMVGGEVLFSIW